MVDSDRLPRSVVPRRYDLTIAPDLEAATFTGTVTITIEVLEPTDTVTLHAKDLVVGLQTVEQRGAPVPATPAFDPDRDRIAITCDHPLAPGEATLALSFRGQISSGLVGFYRSRFVDESGRERVLAATQFEAPHARRAFPCFDEPEFKAVFAITLMVADDLVALSNGPEIERTVADGIAGIRFADTIPISTYIVAWVVGPFELTAPVDAGGVPVRVAHVPGRDHLTGFALEIGAFALRFFADYYGIPYPGEKCDLVALPDFAFGAMENLGCVTFREARLLLDPEQVTLDELTGAARTIVHEIAHMWFGDLVTMKWWNGIWLNEAFATFMEHLGVDAYRPDWQTWDDFVLARTAALDVDALATTRTVEYEVHTPADADGMFDTLTYEKGGSVLRMLERWLGADAFRAGVRHYLDRYQRANTETTDLWDALEYATGQPVRQIMDSWIFQPGFPVLHPNAGNAAQRRFAYHGEPDDSRWAIPLRVRVHHNDQAETRSLLLAGDQVALDAPNDALVVLNAGGQGFYRIAYPSEWRDQLLDAGVLSALERTALVDDQWAAVLAGSETAAEFLEVSRRFAAETELVVWRILSSHLRAAGRLVDGDALAALKAMVASLIAPALTRLGWETRPEDDPRTRRLRGLLIGVEGAFVADRETVARAREVVARPQRGDADIVAACISVVASVGTVDDFETFWQRAEASTSPQEQLRYLYALGEFPDEMLVLRTAALANSDAMRAQSAPFVLQRALRSREHGPAAWAFVRDHWDELRSRFSPGLIPRMLEGITWLVDDASAADIPAFLEAHPLPQGARVIAQHVERLHVHRAAVERERERFAKALLNRA
jgi:puromycin-sensitive aminopeptidase